MKQIKHYFYLFSFTVLGILFGFLLHAMVEIYYIQALISNFSRFGLGLIWSQWYTLHAWWTGITLVAGAGFGFLCGKYWWRVLYIEKRYRKIL